MARRKYNMARRNKERIQMKKKIEQAKARRNKNQKVEEGTRTRQRKIMKKYRLKILGKKSNNKGKKK